MSKPQKPEKPKCQRCQSTEVVTATDHSNKHYCQKCQHVWVPGLEGMKREDVLITHLKTENMAIKLEIEKLRKENLDLKTELNSLKGEPAAGEPVTEEEIFS